jgi:hypothetical protein
MAALKFLTVLLEVSSDLINQDVNELYRKAA